MSDVPGAYVHRVSKGYKRLFFNVSLPLDAIKVDDQKLVMDPGAVGKDIAAILDLALGLRPGDRSQPA